MKWIGQHIWKWVSRFRNDVYLESLTTTTDTTALVVDANDKVCKNVTSGVNLTNGADNRVVTAIGTNGLNAESTLTYDGATLSVQADANTNQNALFIDANNLTTASAISLDIDDNIATDITRPLINIDYDKLGVTGGDQTSTTYGLALNMRDQATNNPSGNVTMYGLSSILTFDNPQGSTIKNIALQLKAAGGIENLGMLSNIQDGGIDIKKVSSADVDDYCTIATGAAGATTLTTVDSSVDANAHFEIAADGSITLDAAGQIKLEPIAGNNILLDGTVAIDAGQITGVTAMQLLGDTGDTCTIASTTHGATSITTVDAAAAAATFTVKADGKILIENADNSGAPQGDIWLSAGNDMLLDVNGDRLRIISPEVRIDGSGADEPVLKLKSIGTNTTSGILNFVKDRGNAGVDGDDVGTILFTSDNTSQQQTNFASIVVEVSEADDSDEAGKLTLNVAESNGSSSQLSPGLILEGEHSTDGEVDVTIANGAASTTTVAGDLTVTGGDIVLGAADGTESIIKRLSNASGSAGATLRLQGADAVGTNIDGGDMRYLAGLGTGTGDPGGHQWLGSAKSVSGTNAHSLTALMNLHGVDGVNTLKLLNPSEGGIDWLSVAVGDQGATTISTVDDGGDTAHLTFDIDGDFSVASTGIDIATNGTITNAVWSGDKIVANKVTQEQIVNLSGFCTLTTNYQYNEDSADTKAPFEVALGYGSATIGSGTTVSQSSLFRGSGFHVPHACEITDIQIQSTCNGSGGGDTEDDVYTIALVEYRPTNDTTSDYPRTVYVEEDITSLDHNSKVVTTDVDASGSMPVLAGSHLQVFVKGDSEAVDANGTVQFSVSIKLEW